MASNKVRSKNDTWTSEELQMALKEDKGNKKSQDMASRRKHLREEEEKEARQLKEARKAKRADQNSKTHTLIDEEERRRKRREQRAKEGNAPDEDEEQRRRRRHERKLKEGNLFEDKDEEEQKRRRHERKLKEANQAKEKDEEEQKQRRHERKLKEANQAKEEAELTQKRHERKSKEEKILANHEEEERRRRRHEKRKEGKESEKDDEERRRKRHERKLKEENQDDEDKNERRQRRHEKKSKDENVINKEERRQKRHERELKEGKIAEEEEDDHKQRKQRKLKEANMADNITEERHHRKREHSKKGSEKTTHQNVSRQETKSAGDKNLDDLKKTKKNKHYNGNNENDKQDEMAKGDIKSSLTQPENVLERKESEESAVQDEYNYDEDFEDYSDDFDNDSAPENSSSQEKSFQKNTDHSYLSSADSRSRDSAHISSAEKSSSPTNERSAYQVMDFSHAKLRKMTQKAKSKLQSRSDDLCSLIALDVAVGQEVFELAPISEYELYIRNFGKANCSQVYVQTGDDNVDRDIQTEEIESLDKWTQHPPNGPAACGGNHDQNSKQTDFAAKSQQHDSARLNKFLLQATQMISILLEENLSSHSHNLTQQKSSQMPFSKSFFTLSSCPLFQDYTIDCCCFANSLHADYLLTVHNPPDVTIKERNGVKPSFLGSYVALWDLRTPSRPYKILYSESTISCCFGSLKSQLVLAGCVDGAVVVWDLRESESLHKHVNFEDLDFCVRYPAYNTASVLSFNSHCNTIQTIRDIPLQVGRQKETLVQKESFNSGFTCQLLSMDQSGLVNLWVIVEVSSVESSGSQVDLGLSPGSRIKLEHTSSINVHAAVRDSLFSTSINTQQLCLLPKDPNQIYISTDTGHIIHSVRLGSQPYPRVHCPRKVTPSSGVLSHVLSLEFSPFMAPCFLTGHSDGSVNLYHTSLECPIVTWLPSQTETKSILSVCWSQRRPTVFYVLDDSSTLFVFDLLEQDNTAVCINTYEDRLSSFNVICNTNDNNHTEKMVLCFANGRIEVHSISDSFSECQTLEMDFLENYLHRM